MRVLISTKVATEEQLAHCHQYAGMPRFYQKLCRSFVISFTNCPRGHQIRRLGVLRRFELAALSKQLPIHRLLQTSFIS